VQLSPLLLQRQINRRELWLPLELPTFEAVVLQQHADAPSSVIATIWSQSSLWDWQPVLWGLPWKRAFWHDTCSTSELNW